DKTITFVPETNLHLDYYIYILYYKITKYGVSLSHKALRRHKTLLQNLFSLRYHSVTPLTNVNITRRCEDLESNEPVRTRFGGVVAGVHLPGQGGCDPRGCGRSGHEHGGRGAADV